MIREHDKEKGTLKMVKKFVKRLLGGEAGIKRLSRLIALMIAPVMDMKQYGNSKQEADLQKMHTGKKKYEQLQEKNEYMVVCGYGIGDTLTVLALMHEYKLQHKINQEIYIVCKEEHKELIQWYSSTVKHISMTSEEILCLVYYLENLGIHSKTKIVNGHLKSSYPFLKYKVFHYYDNYVSAYKYILGLKQNSKLQAPDFTRDNNNRKKISVLKHSILLLPTAYSISTMDISFWNELIDKLGKKFHLYTNVANEKEHCLNHTIPFCVTKSELMVVVDEFDYVIALRSGICDALAFTNCNLIILEFSDWFRVDNLNLRSNIVEIDINCKEKLVDEVLSVIQ